MGIDAARIVIWIRCLNAGSGGLGRGTGRRGERGEKGEGQEERREVRRRIVGEGEIGRR